MIDPKIILEVLALGSQQCIVKNIDLKIVDIKENSFDFSDVLVLVTDYKKLLRALPKKA